KQHSKILKIYF
ncbi:hypothetical protein CPC197_0716B, partial [Chlamydia psittaci C1/97]